ncbi:MAG: response regulator [Nitrospirae bacterium]|nr:response regulator [Nitrospirota bacterium]
MTPTTGSHAQARTVLVVAGNADTRAVILEHAKAQGHVVVSAATPALGLTTFDMTQPDIVITDLFQSEQNGIMLVKQIHERRPTCPIVVLTDAGHGKSTLEGVRAGALDYVEQPIHEEAFAQVLQRAIQRLPVSVDDAPRDEPVWRLLHVYGDTSAAFLVKREAQDRQRSAELETNREGWAV